MGTNGSSIPIIALWLLAGLVGPCVACTDFILKAADGSVVNGRTLEFGVDLQCKLLVTPRGTAFQSQTPTGNNGLHWKNKLGYFGLNVFDLPVTIDGVNEKGLSIGALWLPGYTQYESISPGEEGHSIAISQFGDWLLGNFATVDEIRSALESVKVWGDRIAGLGNQVPPLHLAVHDAAGKSIVIEFVGGSKQVYDNPADVMTNAPPFPWHLTNLRNYLQLSPVDPGAKKIGGQTYQAPGQGSGLLGLPGDWSPPSRFVRTCAMLLFSTKPTDAKSAVSLASHIINAVDIPLGVIREESPEGVLYDHTLWSVIKDQRNLVFYYRGYAELGFKAYPLSQYKIKEGAQRQSVALQ